MTANEPRKLLRHNFYVFELDERRYGIDIGYVREVKELTHPEEITPLPHSQRALLGYINVRGAVHQVVSLLYLLCAREETPATGGMVIYCKDDAAQATGIYAPHPGEILQVEEREIDRWEGRRQEKGVAGAWGDFMACGACRTPRGVITILDPRRIYQAAIHRPAPASC